MHYNPIGPGLRPWLISLVVSFCGRKVAHHTASSKTTRGRFVWLLPPLCKPDSVGLSSNRARGPWPGLVDSGVLMLKLLCPLLSSYEGHKYWTEPPLPALGDPNSPRLVCIAESVGQANDGRRTGIHLTIIDEWNLIKTGGECPKRVSVL